MFDRICLWSHLVLDFCFWGVLKIAYSVLFLVIGLFKWSISSWFSFGGLYISRKVSISSRLSNFCWHIIVHIILLWVVFCFFVFCISTVSVEISPFSFLNLFGFSLLGESGQRFVNFVYSFKKLPFGFIGFFPNVFISVLLIFLIFDFLTSADFRFCLLFF